MLSSPSHTPLYSPGAASPLRWNAPRPAPSRLGAAGPSDLNIALCVPLGGAAGLWGPSALSCARLAVAELNHQSGIAARACRLLTVNAADDAPDIEETLVDLVSSCHIDAIVGMHISAVRQRIVGAVGGQIPYVYTPLYEGGETTPGVFAIGETASRQLRPAIEWLGKSRRPRRWLAVGNDYVWPRVSHALARQYIASAGGELIAETYVPLGTSDYSQVLDQVRKSRADAVLVSLIGQDAIDFNRAFGGQRLSDSVLRLSCAIDENELLGIGANNTDNLYVACGYFSSLDTDANLAFKERYYNHFGERAPTLSNLGQSTYEGVHFLAALLKNALESPAQWDDVGKAPIAYKSARKTAYFGAGVNHTPIYLARAEGNVFRVINGF